MDTDGDSKSFPLVPTQARRVVDLRVASLATALNTTGIYNALRMDPAFQSAKEQFATFVSGFVEHQHNQAFHNSLNFFQKLGFVDQQKLTNHQRMVGVTKGVSAFLAQAGPDLAIWLLQRQQSKAAVATFVQWAGFVARTDELRIRAHARRAAGDVGLAWSEDDHRRYIEDGACTSSAGLRPERDPQLAYVLFNAVLQAVDTSSPDVRSRAMELAMLCGLSPDDAEVRCDAAQQDAEFISDVTGTVGFAIPALMLDLVADAKKAAQSAEYVLENDVFHATREHRKKIVMNVGVPIALGALTVYTGGVGDALIAAGAPMVASLINDERAVAKSLEISKRLRKGVAGLHSAGPESQKAT